MKKLLMYLLIFIHIPLSAFVVSDIVIEVTASKHKIDINDSLLITVKFINFSENDYYVPKFTWQRGVTLVNEDHHQLDVYDRFTGCLISYHIPRGKEKFFYLPANSEIIYKTYKLTFGYGDVKYASPNTIGYYIKSEYEDEYYFLDNEQKFIIQTDYWMELYELDDLSTFILENNVFTGRILVQPIKIEIIDQ